MKKGLAGFLVLTALSLYTWTWTYDAYERTVQASIASIGTRDGKGAIEAIRTYRESHASYLIRNVRYLERFDKRLRYHEGVAYLLLGDDRAAEDALREAAKSPERDIAARAFYDLAFPALNRNDLEGAKNHLAKALELKPSDVSTKVNLELLLQRIKAQGAGKGKGEKGQEGQQQPAQSDLWRLDIPKNDGSSNSGSRRSYR